jgi:Holliday junction resolvase
MTFNNSTVIKGSHAEYAVSKKLESLGFSHIIRSYASHGPIDLLCTNGSGELWAVQVKSAKHGSYLSPKELDRLFDWSKKFGAKPVFAYKKRGRWILRALTSTENVRAVLDAMEKDSVQDDNRYSLGTLLEEIHEDEMNEL